MNNFYVLGLNVFHSDSSAALLKDGNIVCAMEEERFKRIKHWAGIPIESIKFCLASEGISIRDVRTICIGRNPKAKLYKKIIYLALNWTSIPRLLFNRLSNRNDLGGLRSSLIAEFGYSPEIIFVEHHTAHLASAFFSSPFQKASVLSIDGSGDFSTVMLAKGVGNKLDIIKSQDFPQSVGLVYTAFTQFLGFPHYGDEYKVMGLSPYGKPLYVDEVNKIFGLDRKSLLRWNSSYFNVSTGVISYKENVPIPERIFVENKFESLFGKRRQPNSKIIERHKNIASSIQSVTEDIIFGLVNRCIDFTDFKNVAIAGGVAQNSVANGKILENTNATELYVPSAGHDAGISMGAAQYYYFHIMNFPRVEPLYNANLGTEYSNKEIEDVLKEKGLKYKFLDDVVLFNYVAEMISDGKVIGFFEGKSEFGPRALGSRSILADPRNPNAQALLNAKIKKRESFRPFAPSILHEFGEDYFENYQFTPFMERVLKIRQEKRHLIPAVTHVDGSGRLQSVMSNLRPRYYQLIKAFYNITGIPILINTSFNENEPVVNHPEEAVGTFLRTELDCLVLGNFVLEKERVKYLHR